MNTVNARAHCMRPILAAGFALALAFALSACGNDGGGAGEQCGGAGYDPSAYQCVDGVVVGKDEDASSSSGGKGASSSSYFPPPGSSSGAAPSSSSAASSSSSGNGSSSSSSYVGAGGGKGNDISNYRTTKIGEQTWMAENLDYAVDGSRCRNDDPANCAEYGRLYDWATAVGLNPLYCNTNSCSDYIETKHRGICPEGWHIPSVDEWNILISYCTGIDVEKCLKAKSGWPDIVTQTPLGEERRSGGGDDALGFAMLPSGSARPSGNKIDFISHLHYFHSSAEDADFFGSCTMTSTFGGTHISYAEKKWLSSVRCIED